ncbi:MAG: ATP-binding cassette domain-containing protein [Thermaerobacter sp.]|nr:ATP-binding cassette domain-containing protein [Thermaerobacter sp.]
MSQPVPGIRAEGLSKEFVRRSRWFSPPQRTVAVENLSFRIEPGEFVGFLGPNGAGKSTTIKMLVGILHPTGGRVTVNGLSPQRERIELVRSLGIVFGQRSQLWWDLPLRESFEILRALYRIPASAYRVRRARLVDLLELAPLLDQPVRQLSLGQRMRGELAGALLHSPPVLFLDEPTIGLDIAVKSSLRHFLRQINREDGVTILLTTHDMSDVEQLCSRMLVINHGRKVFDGARAELEAAVGVPHAVEVSFENPPRLEGWTPPPTVAMQATGTDTFLVEFNRERISLAQVLEELRTLGTIRDLALKEPSLDRVIEELY